VRGAEFAAVDNHFKTVVEKVSKFGKLIVYVYTFFLAFDCDGLCCSFCNLLICGSSSFLFSFYVLNLILFCCCVCSSLFPLPGLCGGTVRDAGVSGAVGAARRRTAARREASPRARGLETGLFQNRPIVIVCY
jgi:hypothetical protein